MEATTTAHFGAPTRARTCTLAHDTRPHTTPAASLWLFLVHFYPYCLIRFPLSTIPLVHTRSEEQSHERMADGWVQ